MSDSGSELSLSYLLGDRDTVLLDNKVPTVVEVKELPLEATECILVGDFGLVSPVLKVVVQQERQKKSAYLWFSHEAGAEEAVSHYLKYGRYRAVVDIEVLGSGQGPFVEPPPQLKYPIVLDDPEDCLGLLLERMNVHPDPKAYVASTIHSYIETKLALIDDDETDEEKGNIAEAFLNPELLQYIKPFPRCKALIAKIRSIPGHCNKTPASVIQEYASRSGLLVVMEMLHCGQDCGPFSVECRICSRDKRRAHVSGIGVAPTKKAAKQAASSNVMEKLLAHHSESEFLPSRPGQRASKHDRGYFDY